MKKVIIASVLIILFLFIRFYRINNSLFFFDDMGRDLLVLFEWQNSGKIPLVGPQTSALPVNQSPIYYFFLMPFYLLFKSSPYSALIANATVYLICFLLGLYLTKSEPNLNKAAFGTFLLLIFHPQHILQNRFVWNPSLLSPILFLSLMLLFLFVEKTKPKYLFFSSGLLCLAVSLNYSVFPLLIVYFLVVLIYKPEFFRKFILYTAILFIAFNLTALAQLGKRFFLTGTLARPDQIFQTGAALKQKLTDYIIYVLGLKVNPVSSFLLGAIFLSSFYLSIFSRTRFLKLSAGIFLVTSILTLLSPFNLLAHYIFAITASFFLFVGFLNWRIKLPLILFLLFNYLQPGQLSVYFRPAPRTYWQMNSCFKQFCSQFKQPLFVSVQSDLYPYHYGPEHRYLMIKNGCQVKHIEKEPNEADYMAVVLDSGSFSEKTQYYELSLFDKFKQSRTFNCQPNFSIVLLKKSP